MVVLLAISMIDEQLLFSLHDVFRLQHGVVSNVYVGLLDGVRTVVKCIFDPTYAPKELAAVQACTNVSGIVSAQAVYTNVRFHGRPCAAIIRMLYYPGGDLLNHLVQVQTPLTVPEIKQFLRQMLETLRQIHALHYAHLDLKPENIVLDREDTVPRYRLLDFGHSRHVADLNQPQHTTPIYQAPEIGTEHPSPYKSDIYSLGKTCLVLLYGTTDIGTYTEQESFRTFLQRIPVQGVQLPLWISTLLEQMLAIDPVRRISVNNAIRFLQDHHPRCARKLLF